MLFAGVLAGFCWSELDFDLNNSFDSGVVKFYEGTYMINNTSKIFLNVGVPAKQAFLLIILKCNYGVGECLDKAESLCRFHSCGLRALSLVFDT